MKLLSVDQLNIGLAGRRGVSSVIEDVSFAMDEGEILGVVGESGAGKSLTGLAILGLLDHPLKFVSGCILFDGRRIDLATEAELREIRGRSIGAVFQDSSTSLNPIMTVKEQMTDTLHAHFLISRREAANRALDLLVQVGVPAPRERLTSYSHELSGGMRQRVVLALALACDPRLVIADEPTTALDVSVQAQIINLIKERRDKTGTSFLLITHDMGVIAQAASRVAVMYAGRIVETAPTRDVLKAPRHPYTQNLIAAIPRVRGRTAKLQQIDGSMPSPGERPTGCAFHPRCQWVMPRCITSSPPHFRDGASEVACWLFAANNESQNRAACLT